VKNLSSMFSKYFLIKVSLTLLFTWMFMWNPELKLDMEHVYSMTGLIKAESISKRVAYKLLVINHKKQDITRSYYLIIDLYTRYGLLWPELEIEQTPVLQHVIDKKIPVEVVYAKQMNITFGKGDVVAEIRLDGKSLPGYSYAELIEFDKSCRQRGLLTGSIMLFICLLIVWVPSVQRWLMYITNDKPKGK